ncbi:MAG: glycine zipper 2TM domain-containing protein [Candidatus Rokubacteria bacterium]|nr:glycine zipper 2TM domain-containing protein [Candidatus Rokubacteria bacterium]
MRRGIALAVILSLVTLTVGACATTQSPVTTGRTYEGATAGGVLGAVAGALIDKKNRWRGAVIGGALGAVFGGTVTEISARASREAAQQNRPVSYQTTDGFQRVEAEPVGTTPRGCRQVRERIYQEGQLVRDEVREVCQ